MRCTTIRHNSSGPADATNLGLQHTRKRLAMVIELATSEIDAPTALS